MYVKVINPKTNGQKVFDNAGSARRTTNYLEKEAKENGREATFFTSPDKPLLMADEVVALIDGNQKGLRATSAKFYSLVLSPGAEELAALGADGQILAAYMQQAMDLYAKNFQFKSGHKLREADLVWAATVHEERKSRGTDVGVQGQLKPGLQTHVHIIVSARDATQKHTLNPLATVNHFSRVQYQAQACVQLDEQLGLGKFHIPSGEVAPSREQQVAEKALDIQARAAANQQKKALTPAQLQARDKRLQGQVVRVNSKRSEYQQLDPQQVKAAAEARGYDVIFYRRLRQIELNSERGTYTPAPYAYLTTGLVQRAEAFARVPTVLPTPTAELVTFPEEKLIFPDAQQSLERTLQALSRTLVAQQQAYAQQPGEAAESLVTVPSVPSAASETGQFKSPLAAVVEVPAEKPDSSGDSPASEPPLTLDEQFERWEAAKQAEANEAAWDAAWKVREELADQTRQQVATAATTAQQTGASFAFLLNGQGLEVVTQESGQLVGVRHRASGELFTPDEVPVPPAAQAVMGRLLVQYGFIELDANASFSAEERLEKCRTFLSAVGVATGQVMPATAGQLAHLPYCFAVHQGNQEQVASKLNELQDRSAARIYEAPHPLRTPDAPATGVAVPQAQWSEREGQFNQATLVFELRKSDSPHLASRVREELLKCGAAVSEVLNDGHGHLEVQVHYHTHTPRNEQVQGMLGGAQLSGAEVRQGDQAAQALRQGVVDLSKRDKKLEISQITK
ncbi:hypothetical protein GCM10027422_34960 [Hymenobacter arcticus]